MVSKKKRSSSQKRHEIRCQSTKNTNLGLDLHSSSPDPVNFFWAQSSLGGTQFSFGGHKQSFGGHGPCMPLVVPGLPSVLFQKSTVFGTVVNFLARLTRFSVLLVEASHAKVTQGAIAFFSYIWFKYDILSLHCCKLCSAVDIVLGFQPSYLGSIRAWVANAWNGRIRSIDAVCRNGIRSAQSNLYFALKPCIKVRVGAAMPA